MTAPLAMLNDMPMFELLDGEERRSLSALLEIRRYAKGQRIFSYGDPGDSLYIVSEGRVEVFVESTEGTKILLAENERGDCFGEISMIDGGARTATAVALEDTETLTLDREQLLALFTKHPHSALDLLSVMGRRLRATDELLRTHVSRNANVQEEELLTLGQRIADRVAVFGGSWTFIITFGAGLAIWMALNSVLAARAFDPFPFILLNLVLSTLAALQAPVIMMSQNRQAFKDRLNAELDYQVNLKAELEVAHLHRKVDRIYEEMKAHFVKLERGR